MTVSNQTLSHKFTVDSVSALRDTDTTINVVKRRESILYRTSLPPSSANIAYTGIGSVGSDTHLSIADRSTSLPANRVQEIEETTISSSKQFTIDTENFVVTDVFVNETETFIGNPLFYKHTLDADLVPRDSDGNLDTGVSFSNVQILDNLFQAVKVSDLKVDYTTGVIYNNLMPDFIASDNYTVYYVKFTVNDNGSIYTYTTLLSNEAVYGLADFSDLTTSLELKTDGRKKYLIDEIISGYQITLPVSGTYAYKPLSTARIKIIPPVSSGATDPWFVRITNGTFFATVNGTLRKYYISEFLSQSFYPEPPIKSVGSEESAILSQRLIKFDHENIYQDSDLELFVNILIFKSDGTAVAALTTNPSIVGNVAANGKTWKQWSTTTRYGIKSVDHKTGYADIEGISLQTSWEATSAYYYSEDRYEFNLINFNPVSNSDLLTQRIVLFIDPDTASVTKSQTLYYLKVDETGRVIESNWPTFDNTLEKIPGPPNLPLYYESFPSWKPSESHIVFVSSYTTEGTGNFLILGDVTVSPAGRPEEVSYVDSRRRGGGIIDTQVSEVLEDYPEAQWVWDEGNWDGIPFPGNASYLVEVPVDTFQGAGGELTQDEVKKIVDRHTAGGVYPVVKAYGVDVTVSGIYPSATSITLEWDSDEY